MRFLCSTFGSSGDVFPMLGLAIELHRRGHEVIFATNEHFGAMTREQGLKFETLGTEEQFQECIKSPELWHPRRSFQFLFSQLQSVFKPQYDLFERYAQQGPLVGIVNCLSFGAYVASEKLDIPVLTLHCQPAVLWSDIEPPKLPGLFGPRWLRNALYRLGERFVISPVACPFLNSWRRELGLPPIGRITKWWNSPSGVLCMFPDWYCAPQADWPTPYKQTNFPLWNHQSNRQLSSEVEAYLACGNPPIVFTPGSANLHGREFFEAASQACAQLNHRGIFLTDFPEQLPSQSSDTFIHFRYVPLDLLLPRCAAFVHHGGIGSSSQAMLAGIPQILMPLAHDQFDNAERIRRLGIGDSIPQNQFTGHRVAAMLRRLLESREMAAACKTIAFKLADRNGLKRSADAVEDLLRHPGSSESTHRD